MLATVVPPPATEPWMDEVGTGEVGDEEFVLDLRVVESATRYGPFLCDTSDGCGETCEGSACVSVTNDPS